MFGDTTVTRAALLHQINARRHGEQWRAEDGNAETDALWNRGWVNLGEIDHAMRLYRAGAQLLSVTG